MNDRETLDSQIRRLRRRVRLLLVERYCLFGASIGAIAAAVVALLSGRFDLLVNYALWAGVALSGALLGAIYGMLKRLSNLTVAKAADERAGLKQRLSSALSAEPTEESDSMIQALVADAAGHAAPLNPSNVFLHRFGKPHAVFGLAMLVLLAAVVVPQLPGMQSQVRRQEVEVMKKEGKKLVKVAKELKKAVDPDEEELRKMAEALDKLGKQMQTGRLTRKQAMLKTRKLEQQIKSEQDRLARENSRSKSMEEARAEMQKAGEELAKEMAEKLAKQESIPFDDAMKKLPSDARMAELAAKDGQLSETEMKELEKLVDKYADPNSTMPVPKELAEALAKLAANKDFQKAMELMQKLSAKLEAGNMSEMDREALQKQLEQLAKALEGTDLDAIAKMMLENAEKLAQMSPEELQKLADQMKEMQQLASALEKAGGT